MITIAELVSRLQKLPQEKVIQAIAIIDDELQIVY